MKMIIAIDLGGTNLKMALVDSSYVIRYKTVYSTRALLQKERLISGIVNAIQGLLEENKLAARDILGVGIGLPGPIDAQRGIVHFLPNIPGFKNIHLKDILQKRLRMPVAVDNDAKLMTLAEFTKGAASGFRNALCLTLGTGVGGGLILNGQLYRGSDNASGEIGHVPLNESGRACNCGGIACLEAYIGNNRILTRARRILKRRLSLEELSDLARGGDAGAIKVWDVVGTRLGVALAGTVNLLNLDAVVIGGGVANAGRVLFDAVNRTLRQRAMPVQAGRVRVLKARLGSDSGMIGAAILVNTVFAKRRSKKGQNA